MIIEGVAKRLQIEHFFPIEKPCFHWNATCRKTAVWYYKRVSGMSSVHYQILYLPTPSPFLYPPTKNYNWNHWSFLESFLHIFIRWVRPLYHFHCRWALRDPLPYKWANTIQGKILSGHSTLCLHQTLFLTGTSNFPAIPITAGTSSISSLEVIC